VSAIESISDDSFKSHSNRTVVQHTILLKEIVKVKLPIKMSTLCIIYVSEGRKLNIIKQLTQKASSGGPFVHSFVDATYGRTSFYLMGEIILFRIAYELTSWLDVLDKKFKSKYLIF
jgi:Formiminotransferase domain, N-terminal subdomain